ncbi:hypothetical protein GCM10010094_60890 [Streptomyces flaveus]|uniref:Uncharacterized protein n=1 Tax=Streptomyces flaveus TaxID=66370 RepID=A0A917R6X0_9ACTN|nr:hypothetical protein GCM10010094_60890 [Streptomyces flaveus]
MRGDALGTATGVLVLTPLEPGKVPVERGQLTLRWMPKANDVPQKEAER